MSEKRLAGRKALVTGGARGIGAAIAEALTNAGASVMIGDILADLGKETASRLAKTGAKTGFMELNVVDDAQWEKAVAATIATFGGYDILINNAGIEITSLVVDLKAEDLRRMCDVNIVGTGLGMKHAFRAMRPGGGAGAGGAIVNIASVAATIAFPAIAGYSGTKSAVDRMTRVAAMEAGKLGYGVRVNCLYPGLVPTDMGMQLANDIVAAGLAADVGAAVSSVVEQTPLGRLGEVGDMADAAVFLCSNEARFITGAGLPVDGRFGAGVSRNGRERDRGRDRRDIDDGAAGTCRPTRSHRAKRMLHAKTGADNVDIAHPAQVFCLDVDHERGDLDTCIVDQDVVATERGDGGCDSLFPLRVVGDVQLDKAGLGPCLGQTAGGLPAQIGENVADHHRRAGVRKRACDRGADASRAAGDQSLAACQTLFTHRMLLPL